MTLQGRQGVVPVTFAEGVRRRVAGLGTDAQAVLQAGAILGRSFDWTLLGPTVKLSDELVVGEFLGLPGYGRRIHVRVLHVFEFRDGLISTENVWLDGASVIAQLTPVGQALG